MLSEEELELIQQKMKQVDTTNFGEYARKMLIDGYIVKTDLSALKEVTIEMSRIGNNVNQIARLVNEKKQTDLNELQEVRLCINQIWNLLKKTLRKFV